MKEMENHSHPQHSNKVLSMDLSCCDECPKLLSKKLLKMPGVESVDIDTKENLVFVTGPVDAKTLVDKLAKLGKPVRLLPSDTNCHVDDTKSKGHCPHKEAFNTEKMREKSSRRQTRQRHKKEVEPEHKCEPYDSIKINPRYCRDPFCTTHPIFYKIVDNLPAQSSPSFGDMGFGFGGGNPFRGPYSNPGLGLGRGWYGQGQELPPNVRFGYYPNSRMSRGPFGFH